MRITGLATLNQNYSLQELNAVDISFLLTNALTNKRGDVHDSAIFSRIRYTRLGIFTEDEWALCDAV